MSYIYMTTVNIFCNIKVMTKCKLTENGDIIIKSHILLDQWLIKVTKTEQISIFSLYLRYYIRYII